MTPETLRTAMTEWGVYFNRSVKDSLIDIYWKHVKDFSDGAMRVVQADVMRTEQFFPKLSVLLPLLQRQDYRRNGVGPLTWRPSSEGLADGYGEWSERDLVKEARGLPALFVHLFCALGFENEDAFDRMFNGCKEYVADLVAGLRSVGEKKRADALEQSMARPFAKLEAARQSAKEQAAELKESGPMPPDVKEGVAAVKSVFDGPPPF